jgi:hypothetical protein
MEKTYKNPVAGRQGVFCGNMPEQLTRRQLIELASEGAVGTCQSLCNAIDSFLLWIEQEGGDKVDFRFDDLTMDELKILDDIVFTCSACGWNYEISEREEHEDEAVCRDCYETLCEDDDDEESPFEGALKYNLDPNEF